MCLPSPKIPDTSAQIKAQQDALKAEQESQEAKEMQQAKADALRQQKRRRGRASLITRSGGSGSLGILDDKPLASSGLRPLGVNFNSLSNRSSS